MVTRFVILALVALGLRAGSPVTPGRGIAWGGTGDEKIGWSAFTNLTDATYVSTGSRWGLGQRIGGTVLAWGSDNNGDITNCPTSGGATHSDAGWQHGIRALSTGVEEWADPIYGVSYSTWTNSRPSIVNTSVVSRVAAGDAHSAALIGGKMYVWGVRSTVTNYNSDSFTNIIDIDSNWYYPVMLLDNGTVWVGGTASGGPEQGSPYNIPAALTNGTKTITHIQCGQFYNAARCDDGTGYVWGFDGAPSPTPAITNINQSEFTNLLMLAVGREHVVGLLSNKTVRVWGDNTYGQTNTPANATNLAFIATGAYASYGIQESDPTNMFYVALTGSDSTGTGTYANPFRTVQKGVDVATDPGDTVVVMDGNYWEEVASKASGTVGNPITIKANTTHGARIREFRVNNHTDVTVSGFQIAQATSINNAMVRVEPNADRYILTNLLVGPGAYAMATNFGFGTDFISSPTVDFAAAGFTNGSRVFFGGAGMTNPPYWYTNHDTAHVVKSNSVDGHTMYVTDTLDADGGTNYWAFTYAGSGNDGLSGVQQVIGSGIDGATNGLITHCVFSNIAGAAFFGSAGDGLTMQHCTVRDMPAYYGFRWNGRNARFAYNTWLNNHNVLWYAPHELSQLTHPEGGGWFDYQIGHLRMEENGAAGLTNNLFATNWVEDVENQLGFFGQSTNGARGWTLHGNVFYGIGSHMSASIDDFSFENNTVVFGAYEPTLSSSILAAGGKFAAQTNLNVSSNIFLAGGSHVDINQEGSFGISGDGADAATLVTKSNYAARAETMGYGALVSGATSNYYSINGGTPLLYNTRIPRGADGLPFTADDGLRPLPHSPLAIHGLGALTPFILTSLQPVAHFRQTSTVAWQDATGTNYNDGSGWLNKTPFGRGAPIRPYTTPEALGRVPLTTTFSATGAISGLVSWTNNFGLESYRWDFGDGCTAVSHYPIVDHTFLSNGTFNVVLTVTNVFGNSHSMSNLYRVLPQTNATEIWWVKNGGSDSAAGTNYATAFATVNKATTVAGPGDYVNIMAGNYPEVIDLDAAGTSGNPVTWVFHSSTLEFIELSAVWNTIEGFIVQTNVAGFEGVVHVSPNVDFNVLRNFQIIGVTNKNHLVYFDNSGVTTPDTAQLNNVVDGALIVDCILNGGIFSIQGTNNLIRGAVIGRPNGQADVLRPFGIGHTMSHCYGRDISLVTENHSDIFQTFNSVCQNLTITNCWFRNGDMQGCQLERDDSAPGQGGPWPYTEQTNIVIVNTIFENIRRNFNVDWPGVKFHQCLFYKVNTTNLTHVFALGGNKGNANGFTVQNCAFVECGSQATNGLAWYPTPGDGGITNYDLTCDYNYAGRTNGLAYQYFTTEANGVNGGAPLFVSPSTGDFRLQSTNSVLWSAAGSTTYTVDIAGFARASDIGPLEFQGPAEEPPEPPPSTNRVLNTTTVNVIVIRKQ